MNELESLYGAIGLGIITLFIPYFLQVLKMVTKWSDDWMLVVSLLVTYLLVDIYYLATMFMTNPEITFSGVLFIVLGMIIYPLLVWFGTQGMYTKLLRPAQKA